MAESEVPIVCTLSSSSRVRRLEAFEAVFAAGLVRVERLPLRLRLTFDVDGEREASLRELFVQEERCCEFLSLEFRRSDAGLLVEVVAPEDAGPTLDGMQALAERRTSPGAIAQRWTG
ncbi:hypothetical protein DZF91_21995 [Actinomadura logoneensis]|uniref:Uncharacterized protein n=1 Tax=Actinomadura logoneensis TaxID=2293572 RepID=A0A372JHJ7_9ACTN|nr:hypothetical protein [Actinomadura logoneensis]RFU39495.1 hypothetical protein DZF91_21995 [Actinomadura logoneensis]